MTELFNPEREADFTDWHAHVILGDGDPDAIAHEAFCAGWESARERISRLAAERQAGTVGLDGSWTPFAETLYPLDRQRAEHARVCSLPFGHQGGHWWDEEQEDGNTTRRGAEDDKPRRHGEAGQPHPRRGPRGVPES